MIEEPLVTFLGTFLTAYGLSKFVMGFYSEIQIQVQKSDVQNIAEKNRIN